MVVLQLCQGQTRYLYKRVITWSNHLTALDNRFSRPMSAATPPASSQSPAAATSANASQEPSNVSNIADRIVLEYLRSRGHTSAEKAFKEEIGASSPSDKGKQPEIISPEELVKSLATFAQKSTRATDNGLKDSSAVLNEVSSLGNSQNIRSLLAGIGSVGAEEILSLDPTDKQEGFRELEAWVDGSLDMYRVCRSSVILVAQYPCNSSCSLSFGQYYFPYFVIFTWTSSNTVSKMPVSLFVNTFAYGSLNFCSTALRFFSTFSPSLPSSHYTTFLHLSTLLLPAHVQSDDIAQRFRNEKYIVRMSRSGFSLLLGWLTEGFGGESLGSGGGFTGEKGKRGRAAVMRVVNNHLRFDGKTL